MTTTGEPATLRERKKTRTREALVETAVSMFGERGFEATPLDALLGGGGGVEADLSRPRSG